jgi:multicomponent Na+:H+ antiporter subunit E
MRTSFADLALCLCIRTVTFFCVWTIVSGLSREKIVVGAFTAAGAASASVGVLPCWPLRPKLTGWFRLALRVPIQALVAGADVARRTLDPALPLNPGFTPFTTSLPEGTAQNVFAALAALQPGSVPIRKETPGAFDIHCLDTNAPIAATLGREEARLREAFGLESRDG